jgi:predicted kinase
MEAVILVGAQGAGKTTFYRDRFFNTHVRINLDMLKTRGREKILVEACLAAGQPFVVDNTNVLAAERARYIERARASGFRVVGYFFPAEIRDLLRRNSQRSGKQKIPVGGVIGTVKRLQPPSRAEGFDELFRVRVAAEGEFLVEPLPEIEPGPVPVSP